MGKPLRQVKLADLVAYGETLEQLAPASRARKLGAVKSLASFGHRIGYPAFDMGAPLRLPGIKTTLAERIRVVPNWRSKSRRRGRSFIAPASGFSRRHRANQ